jgi:hypothetical protein
MACTLRLARAVGDNCFSSAKRVGALLDRRTDFDKLRDKIEERGERIKAVG